MNKLVSVFGGLLSGVSFSSFVACCWIERSAGVSAGVMRRAASGRGAHLPSAGAKVARRGARTYSCAQDAPGPVALALALIDLQAVPSRNLVRPGPGNKHAEFAFGNPSLARHCRPGQVKVRSGLSFLRTGRNLGP